MNATSAALATHASGLIARLRAASTPALRRHGFTFGLALVVGSLLRLIWLDDTSFLGDQAELLALGRSAASHHALIATGILSSIGTLNPPVSTWLYAPFALVGGPLAAAACTALLNIAAIGLLYALATRYGGRRAGFVAALLYATASGAVHYSRFTWQQNLMAPFLLLLLGAVLVGLIERRAGWLGWAALFWGVCVQLHPTAASLLAVIALPVVLARETVRRRDLAWAAAALALLFGPLLLWEFASHGQDLANYVALSSHNPVIDIAAPFRYDEIISPAAAESYGAASSYAATGAALAPLSWIVQVMAFLSALWLILSRLNPWRKAQRAASGIRALSATPGWRLAATLILWQAVPVTLLIRHTAKVQEHYLLVLLPIVYLTIGLWAAAGSRRLERELPARWAQTPRLALLGVTLALALAQTVGVAAELTTIHSGGYDGVAVVTHYGIPLSGEQAALRAAARAASLNHATLAVASTAVQQEPFGYLAQTSDLDATVYASTGCLMVPSPDSARPLVTLALPGTLATRAAPLMAGMRALATLPAQGSAPLTLYRLAPGASPHGEVSISPTSSGAGPRLTGYSATQVAGGAGYLALRWSGAPILATGAQRASYWFGAAPTGPLPANYVISAQPLDSAGKPIGAPITAHCDRLSWSSGIDMLAWLPLAAATPSAPAAWRVTISAGPLMALRPQIGPLPLETGAVSFTAPQSLGAPVVFQTQAAG